MDALDSAEVIRSAMLEAATRAYEDAGLQGLCAEGRWEAAIGAARRLDLRSVPALDPAERSPSTPLVVTAGMLIRRPVAEVFEAFVDPAITTSFWFTDGSARLEAGTTVRWSWAMYGASTEVRVLELEPNARIRIQWDDPPNEVEWVFTARPDGTTYVGIANSGFAGSGEQAVRQALDSMGGFSFVLAGAKAWLEHGVKLNLVADHYPDAHL